MNSREIVFANLNHKNPPRAAFSYDGRNRKNDFLMKGIFEPSNYVRKSWVEGNKEFYDDIWGNIWWREIDGCIRGEIFKPYLEDWNKLDKLIIPDFKQDYLYDDMREAFKKETERFKLAHIGGWIFDNARYLRKLEVYLMDLYEYPEEVSMLNQAIANMYEIKIRKAAECGADGIFIGEDLGTQISTLMSPDMFRRFFIPHYKRLVGLAHELGMKVFLHSCGYNWGLIDDLCESGIDCFQFDQPALYDMEELAEKFKKYKVTLWSPLDIQKILPTGDKPYIEKEAYRLVEIFKSGLILKNYPDLKGIGVEEKWDEWAYEAFLKANNI